MAIRSSTQAYTGNKARDLMCLSRVLTWTGRERGTHPPSGRRIISNLLTATTELSRGQDEPRGLCDQVSTPPLCIMHQLTWRYPPGWGFVLGMLGA